jgi:hypothetical protein
MLGGRSVRILLIVHVPARWLLVALRLVAFFVEEQLIIKKVAVAINKTGNRFFIINKILGGILHKSCQMASMFLKVSHG